MVVKEIFVFGSNLGGYHGGGSAAHAHRHLGAKWGVGVGRTGDCYAIPTKSRNLRRLPLRTIATYVTGFLQYAAAHPELTFKVVAIGCGLAGFTPTQIAPMFKGYTDNVNLPQEFLEVLGVLKEVE